MMSSGEFSSTEELYYEGSPVEPLYDYNQGSQMRFIENVVYIPHVLWPVMLLEYIPVFYNFQTYEPYLINRYEIMYVPFIRQVSVTSFVPYYYQNTTAYTAPEVFSSNTPAVYTNYTQNETDTNSSSQESILDQVSCDELEYDEINSNISYYGDTSILSLSSSDFSSTYEHSELNCTQGPSVSLQGLVSTENDDCFDLRNEDENSNALEYPEGLISAVDEDVSIEGDDCSLSLLLGNDDKGPAELICPEEYLDHTPFDEECEVSSTSSFVDVAPWSLTESDTSILSVSCSNSSCSYEHSEFNSTQEPSESSQGLIFTENNDCFDTRNDDEHKTAREYLEGLINAVDEDVSIEGDGCSLSLVLGNGDKGSAEFDCPEEYLDHIPFDEERDVSSLSSFVDVQTLESLTETVKDEAPSFKDRTHSPEKRANHAVCDNDIETRVSNTSSLEYVHKCQDENGLEQSPLIKEKITRYDSDTSSSNILLGSHEKSLQKQDFPHETDVKVPDPFDNVMRENDNDTHDDSGITLEDILASEEYWKVKREEYSRKTRNTELYKSALQGDIRPRKSLPDVGTMDTIFEDLPYPVNQPYDDGQESKDVYFDLAPLEVQRSMSSKTALLPKKKRFGKTKKFFSQLFRCFRPP